SGATPYPIRPAAVSCRTTDCRGRNRRRLRGPESPDPRLRSAIRHYARPVRCCGRLRCSVFAILFKTGRERLRDPSRSTTPRGVAMINIRPCRDDERATILQIVNAAAEAYRGVIPDDCWHEPYMSSDELEREIAAGVAFWGY